MARRADVDDMPAPLRVGSKAAPVGSEDWAAFCRLELHSMVDDLRKNAERIDGYIKLFHSVTPRAWTMLKREDGRGFAKWEDFCATPQPFGLGRPWPELKPALEAALVSVRGDEKPARVVQLFTVPPAQTSDEQPRGAHGHFNGRAPEEPSDGRVPEEPSGKAHVKRVRAIAERTPEPARELYRRDLLGQKEAAKLGPKSPTPEVAAKVTTIAIELAEVVKAAPKPKTNAERRALKRVVTEKARVLLGEQPEDRVAKLARTIGSLAAEDQARLAELLEAAHPTATGVVAHVRALMPADDAPPAEPERCSPLSCSVCGNTEKRDARAADIDNVIERVMGIEADGAGRARVRDHVLRFLSESVNYGEDVPF